MIARFKEKKIEKYMSLTNFILLRIKQMKNKNVMWHLISMDTFLRDLTPVGTISKSDILLLWLHP